MPFFAPGDAYDNAVGQQAAGRLGPCSTLLGLSSNEDAAVHALLGLASGVNVSAAIPPGGVSAAQGPAPVAAAGSQHSALRETDATKMKRIYNGIYPGKIRCCCDNSACPRGIRGVDKCGGRKCGGLGGQHDVCVCGVGFEIPAQHVYEFHAALTRALTLALATFAKHVYVHSCHFNPADLSFGIGGHCCQPPWVVKKNAKIVPKWDVQVDMQALGRICISRYTDFFYTCPSNVTQLVSRYRN